MNNKGVFYVFVSPLPFFIANPAHADGNHLIVDSATITETNEV